MPTSTLPLSLKPASSNCTPHGAVLAQRADLLMPQTRRRSITWTSTKRPLTASYTGETITSSPWTTSTPHQPRCNYRNGYSARSRSLSEGGNTHGLPEDFSPLLQNAYKSMAFSSMILHTYRMIHSSNGGDRKRFQSRQRLGDMLCSILPCMIERNPIVSEEVRKERETEAILNCHRRTPHTIVLDSPCPNLAPHIVITPSIDNPEDSSLVAQNNTIGCQDQTILYVPPFYRSTCRLPTYAEWMAMYYPGFVPQTIEDPNFDFDQGSNSLDYNNHEDGYSDGSSSIESSSFGSPELQSVGSDVFSCLDALDEEDITDSPSQFFSQNVTSLYNDTPSSLQRKSKQSPEQIFYIYDDDEEDGPPEFDDWYTSWADRMQIAGQS